MKFKILLLGKNGKVGRELQQTLVSHCDVIALGSKELDFTKIEVLRKIIRTIRPDLIINVAALTDIEQAERFPELAMTINARAPGIIAEEAFFLGIPLIHYSTNYVFDGMKNEPYIESDLANPINFYGFSKLEGEKAIQSVGGEFMIFRTCWVYSFYRESFTTKVLDWSQGTNKIRIVTDQISNPTWSRMLANVTTEIISMGLEDIHGLFQQYKGLYHLASKGNVSRYEWAKTLLSFLMPSNKDIVVFPALTSEFPHLTQRPLYCVLNCYKFCDTFSIDLPEWRCSLRLAVKDYYDNVQIG